MWALTHLPLTYSNTNNQCKGNFQSQSSIYFPYGVRSVLAVRLFRQSMCHVFYRCWCWWCLVNFSKYALALGVLTTQITQTEVPSKRGRRRQGGGEDTGTNSWTWLNIKIKCILQTEEYKNSPSRPDLESETLNWRKSGGFLKTICSF